MTFATLTRSSLAAAALIALAQTASAGTYDRVFAFGDSLTDNGNFFAATGGTYPPPPYFNGRFSNGPVAAEVMAADLGAMLHDYAFGGASTGFFNADVPAGPLHFTGVLSQVAGFTAAPPPGATGSGALFLVWAGANDFLNATPADVAAVGAAAIGNLATAAVNLYGVGARDFLFPLMADLGTTPQVRALGPGAAAFASFASLSFNGALQHNLELLGATLPGSHFMFYDTFAEEHLVLDNAAFYGLTNTTDACLTSTSLCVDPSQYFFWDDIHPTSGVAALIGQGFAAAVPEPASMLLAATGVLALIGLGRKRRF